MQLSFNIKIDIDEFSNDIFLFLSQKIGCNTEKYE